MGFVGCVCGAEKKNLINPDSLSYTHILVFLNFLSRVRTCNCQGVDIHVLMAPRLPGFVLFALSLVPSLFMRTTYLPWYMCNSGPEARSVVGQRNNRLERDNHGLWLRSLRRSRTFELDPSSDQWGFHMELLIGPAKSLYETEHLRVVPFTNLPSHATATHYDDGDYWIYSNLTYPEVKEYMGCITFVSPDEPIDPLFEYIFATKFIDVPCEHGRRSEHHICYVS